jgi:multiple sugar transport system permease protein
MRGGRIGRLTLAGRGILHLIMILSSVLMLFPLLWMASASLKMEKDVFEFPIRWIPRVPVWSNYVEIWTRISFLRYFLNTGKLTVAIAALQLLTSSLAGYAFAKVPFPERRGLFLGYLATMMIPFQVVMIPQFIIVRRLGLVDTHLAIVLIQAFTPFGVFLMRQYFLSIPDELLEAARIDGMRELSIYGSIVVPLSVPAFTSLGILTTVFVWNDFLLPLIYLSRDVNRTIQLGIRSFTSQYSTEYSMVMTATMVSVAPLIILFLAAQRFFIEGIAMSGLKG